METFIYLVKCRDNSLYCGWTDNLSKRIDKHNRGKGAKYTKSRLPVVLVYSESFNSGLTKKDNKILAMKREYQIKQLTRKQKLAMIERGGI